jgi:peptide/nickel transport system ATP-binding protein
MVLAVRGLRVRVGGGRAAFDAVDDVHLDVPESTVVGLVGESGSGKSTLARAIVGLTPAQQGQILLDGRDYRGARGRRVRELRRRVQLIFQDPRASLNPRMTVGEALAEAVTGGRPMGRAARRAEVARLLDLVSLEADYARARPHVLSGGERQRVALARALAVRPDVIVADEVTSALDASIQASVLNVLREVRARTGLSMLFISHNLAVVRYMSDAIAVMQLGRIVERGPTEALITAPAHPYTRVLMASASLEGFDDEGEPEAEPPDPLHLPSGCRFRTVCPVGPLVHPEREVCVTQDPSASAGLRVHHAACHFAPLVEGASAPLVRR